MSKYCSPKRNAIDEILLYIWRWKAVPTWMVHVRFFQKAHATAAYDFLYRAKRAGLVAKLMTRNENVMGWTLTLRGFKKIQAQIPELVEPRYQSKSPVHDLLTAVIHGGVPWMSGYSGELSVVTEQQVQAQDLARLIQWYPRRLERASDGFWKTVGANGSIVTALELELTRKSLSSYVDILSRYQLAERLDGVVWICATRSIRRQILAALKMVPRANPSRVWTVLLREFRQMLYAVELTNGLGKTTSLVQLLGIKAQVEAQETEFLDPFDMRLYFCFNSKNRSTPQLVQTGT
jgi:hypothetical protein